MSKYIVRLAIALDVEGTVLADVLPPVLHAAENAAARVLAENGATRVETHANTIERKEPARARKGRAS